MDIVLSLQLLPTASDALACGNSTVSCPSNQSCMSNNSCASYASEPPPT